MRTPRYLQTLLGLAVALTGGVALADAQFMVPVNIKNANPQITKMGVTCRLLSANKAVLGGDQTEFALVNGAYQGTVTLNAKVAAPSSQVKTWECYLTVRMANGTSTEFSTGSVPPDAVQPLSGSKVNIKGDY